MQHTVLDSTPGTPRFLHARQGSFVQTPRSVSYTVSRTANHLRSLPPIERVCRTIYRQKTGIGPTTRQHSPVQPEQPIPADNVDPTGTQTETVSADRRMSSEHNKFSNVFKRSNRQVNVSQLLNRLRRLPHEAELFLVGVPEMLGERDVELGRVRQKRIYVDGITVTVRSLR